MLGQGIKWFVITTVKLVVLDFIVRKAVMPLSKTIEETYAKAKDSVKKSKERNESTNEQHQ